MRPGSEGFARKEHRREKNYNPQLRSASRRMTRAHLAPGLRRAQPSHRAPLQRNNPVLGERTAYTPGPRNDPGLMVFSAQAPHFHAGQCLKFSWAHGYLPKSEAVQEMKVV
jgi:hypothetical protein